jgi:hypothetical protein
MRLRIVAGEQPRGHRCCKVWVHTASDGAATLMCGHRPLADPPADTARGAEAEPNLAVVAGGRVSEERSLIRGLACVEALDNEP